MWMVRCDGGLFAKEFIEQGIVALGWDSVGSLKGLTTRAEVINKVKNAYPEYKDGKAVVTGSQLEKIANVIKDGERVITYDPSARIYHLGRVVGEYIYSPDDAIALPHRRKVKWADTIERDRLSVPTKNTLGSSLSVFSLSPEAEQEIDSLLAPKSNGVKLQETTTSASEEAIDTHYLLESVKTRAKEFIKDGIIALDWEQMQDLVAGLLRAMGYKTRISPKSSDRGKDIIASPDGLGLEQPRIVVEVKHRPGQQMRSDEIRSFLGGRHKDDRGLYISTGGFSKDAKYEADRASIPLTIMDIDDLVELVIENYEGLDLESRSLVPLTKIYWPSTQN